MSTEIVSKPAEVETVEDQTAGHHDSEEYESAEEVEEVSYEEGDVEEVEVEVEVEEEVDEEENAEELAKDKEVDEDRKNPQFIPKKGYFYEHDDRTGAEAEGAEEVEEPVKVEKPKPKAGPREPDRWTHDLFDEEEQAPKTRAELSGRYGYDIRSEDQAPRARRRRRYGRGPTKYTRKWEEEEAYQKPRGGSRGRGGRGTTGGVRQNTRAEFEEEFPELGPSSAPKQAAVEGEAKETRKENYYQTSNKSPSDHERGGRGRGGSSRGRGFDRERQDETRGRGGGRGWGRRNEFSNRNRYPDRRGSGGDKDYASAASGIKKEEKVDQQKDSTKPEAINKTSEKMTSADMSDKNFPNINSSAKKTTGARVPPPFTNTEYKGSESLAVKPQQNINERSSRSDHAEPNFNDDFSNTGVTGVSGREPFQRSDESAGNRYPNDRRAQVPPRLQQTQQPMDSAPKPKRFSTQRQRQNVDPAKTLSPVVTAQGPAPLGVVSGGPPPVSSISSYPASQAYYEAGVPATYEARVYPGSGSSVAVSGSGPGPTVTPSWVPHSSPYVNAPYPSPPTGPQVPQSAYQDPSTYMQPQQGGPPIFAPPPHPQFIQDPTIINYVPPVPPPNYAPSFHPPSFQGYPQVAPPPPPELYHGGVTYYSTQNQMPRPHIPAMNKRPKTVLQLVEPPEKKDIGRHYPGGGGGQQGYDMDYSGYHEGMPPPRQDFENIPPTNIQPSTTTTTHASKGADSELVDSFEAMKLQPEPERVKKSPSPAPLDLGGEKSWSEQMADITPLNSPTDTQGPDPTLRSDKSSTQNEEAKNGSFDSKSDETKQLKVEDDTSSSK